MGKGECLRQKGNIILASEGRCEGIQNRRSTDENHKYQMVERLKGTIKRKDKAMDITFFALTAVVFYALGVAAGRRNDNFKE